MGRVYARESWEDGDILCFEEPNSELGSVAGEMNGHVSSDNLPASVLTSAKISLDVFHGILFVEDAGPDVLTRNRSGGSGWEVLESGSLETEDGLVYVEGQMTYDFASGNGSPMEVGVRRDGEIVARSGPSGFLESDSLTAVGAVPVGPGIHLLELVARMAPGEATSTVGLQVTMNGRSLWARYAAR